MLRKEKNCNRIVLENVTRKRVLNLHGAIAVFFDISVSFFLFFSFFFCSDIFEAQIIHP